MKKYPLIAKCLKAGNVSNLFIELKDWPKEQLNALLTEIDTVDNEAEEVYKDLVFRTEFFFNRGNAEELDKSRMELRVVLSEIASVALHYLGTPIS
jgi:hypothetical protein